MRSMSARKACSSSSQLVERRPGLEQRLVRDLDDAVAVRRVRVSSRASISARDQALGLARQVRQRAGWRTRLPSSSRTPHEMRHERVAQRGKLGSSARLEPGDRLVGGEPHRVLDRIEAALRIAERLVVGERQPLVGGCRCDAAAHSV